MMKYELALVLVTSYLLWPLLLIRTSSYRCVLFSIVDIVHCFPYYVTASEDGD